MSMAELTISYFAKIREHIGRDQDIITVPNHILSIDDMVAYLKMMGDEYRAALDPRNRLYFALDNMLATGDNLLGNAKELAIFPPVTGG